MWPLGINWQILNFHFINSNDPALLILKLAPFSLSHSIETIKVTKALKHASYGHFSFPAVLM